MESSFRPVVYGRLSKGCVVLGGFKSYNPIAYISVQLDKLSPKKFISKLVTSTRELDKEKRLRIGQTKIEDQRIALNKKNWSVFWISKVNCIGGDGWRRISLMNLL